MFKFSLQVLMFLAAAFMC